MSAPHFTVVMLGPGDEAIVMLRANTESECRVWIEFNAAYINKPGSNVFETEDGVVYEIRREAA